MKLNANAIKTTLVIDPGALFGIKIPNGAARVPFEISAGGRVLRGDFNAKSVRKAIAAVEAGEAAVIVQGKLEPGDVLVDAGISAMPKAKKE